MGTPYGGYYAPPPPPPQQQPARGPRPQSVTVAVAIMALNALVNLIGLVISLADSDDIKRKVLEKTPNASKATLDAAVTFAVGIGAAFLIFYVALAFLVWRGKNWARIVTWVFAGLGILSALLSFAQSTTTLLHVLPVVVGLLDVVLVVALARRESSDWFKPRAVTQW